MPGAGLRNISVYSNEQALAEMRKFCKERPVASEYVVGKKLGSGSGGTVFEAVQRQKGAKAAAKSIDLTSGERKVHLLMEVQVMRELVHPNLVMYTDAFLTERYLVLTQSSDSLLLMQFLTHLTYSFLTSELWVIMEYMDAGALTSVVIETVLSEVQMATVCREVLRGLEYLHTHEVVHRDIKSDNVLLSTRGDVKITGELSTALP